ncbi:xylosyltransferase sqv-6-like [Haliotis cracherodii]|uniref:xylosyltransferase sqv-6-like n=1 Tax=Haliotis cracherodii TaxID=6455 RepID=UPI0039ECE05C
MTHCLLPCFALIFTILLHVTMASESTFNFVHSDNLNGQLCTTNAWGQAVVISKLDCAQACSTDLLCISFIYDDVNRLCHVYDKALNCAFDCVNPANQTYIYYIKLVIHTYIGCYNDNRRRVLPYRKLFDDICLTTETCKLHCHRFNYTFFGIEGGRECFCGNVIKDGYTIKPETQCSSPLSGDPSTMGGGHWRISIFKITV